MHLRPRRAVTSLSMPNGITEEYTHDSIGQMLSITQINQDNTTELLSQYTYDPVGNITTRLNSFEAQIPSSVTLNEYNALGQMTTQTERDLEGNILTQFEFTHDLRGNLIKERDVINNTAQTYTFDARNRMILGTNHQGEESIYNYNALNALIGRETRTADGVFTTDYVIDYTSYVPTVLMEYGNDVMKSHVYGNGLSRISTTITMVSEANNTSPIAPLFIYAETFFIQNDRLGSARFATDLNGNRVAHT
ncbi:MAG: hypothetical protein FWD19_05085, partial [Defluviitaleaceae bacterium]|nr:hypothetical protein [Defluviitaleaceae bacterium]